MRTPAAPVWAPLLAGLLLGVAGPAQARKAPAVAFGQTVPDGLSHGVQAHPRAADLWPDLLASARHSIKVSVFYISPREGQGPDALAATLKALKAAGSRGAKVQVLVDAKFAKNYPAPLADLTATAGVQVRRYDMNAITGGVMHAKYMVIDAGKPDQVAWIGSQNLDWRALSHNLELGAAIREPAVVEPLARVFDLDWSLAGGAPSLAFVHDNGMYPRKALPDPGEQVPLTLVASPQGLLPEGVEWDLPHLLGAIETAKKSVHLQVMSYSLFGYDKRYWDDLDRALRVAAAHGVQVRLTVANWNAKPPKIDALKSLAALPNLTVTMVSLPEHKSGFIPFARVIHAKLMVVDDRWAWLGTSNVGPGYFYRSRNVGVITTDDQVVKPLAAFFDRWRTSPWSEVIDPGKTYSAPAVAAPKKPGHKPAKAR